MFFNQSLPLARELVSQMAPSANSQYLNLWHNSSKMTEFFPELYLPDWLTTKLSFEIFAIMIFFAVLYSNLDAYSTI